MSSNVFKMAAACVVACVCTASASAQSRGEPGPTGACCFPDGECSEETFQKCSGLGGVFQGPGTFCLGGGGRGSSGGDGVRCPSPPPPPNDDCENAISLATSDGYVEGTTRSATFEEDVQFCPLLDDRGFPRGVWYKVIGTGTELTIDICAADEQSNARGAGALVNIFCGGCGNLQCIAGRDGGVPICNLGQTSEVSRGSEFLRWCTEEGREYHIFVEIFSPTGDFFIRLKDTGNDDCALLQRCGVEQKDFCEDAQDVCPGITYQGHTFDATSAYFDHGGPIESLFFCGMFFGVYDVWYRYTPAEDGLLFVHVEGPPTEYVFGVYDDCDEATGNLLACNIARHHGVIVWPVEAYETYYIRIAGLNFTRGTFEMDLVAPLCEGDDRTSLSE